ncbi:MAG: alpha/beta hydrolase [Gammaproteobacteria bacterium]|nr:alpha/beta hydrolase [Gammaproteobacteria bacterium]
MSKQYSSEHLFVKTFSLGTYLQGGVGNQHVILAHGAGAGMHHEFMQRLAEALILQGFKVSLFEYAYMQTITATGKRRPPARVSELILEHYQWIDFLAQDDSVWLMGKSMGGRLSSLLAQDALPSQVQGWCALGYPFHPVKKPHQLRVEHLMDNRLPGLIIQGSRDALGNQQEVKLYQLPNSIKLHWLLHMDHSFKPYKQAPLTLQQAIEQSAIWFKQWSQAQI